MKNLITILFLITTFYYSLYAQFESSAEISSYLDDNLYRTPTPSSDFLTDFNLYLGYKFFDEKLSIFYTPDYYSYSQTADHDFIYHSIGSSFWTPFSEEQHYFFAGASLDIRSNQEVFNYLNFNQFYGYLNARFDLDYFYLKTGYNFRYRNYINYTDLSNVQRYIFAQLNRSFATRTSLIVELDYGRKSFLGSDFISSTDTIAVSGGGGHGNGPGSGGSDTQEQVFTKVNYIEPLDLSHVIFLFRIAQSLHQNIGIYVQYRLQKDLSQSGAYNSGGFYFQDEEIFDDPFSYESQALSSQLTWILPWSLQLKTGGAFNQKSYISEQAYTSEDDTVAAGGLRYDERLSIYGELNKSFYPDKNGMKRVQLSLNWNLIHNQSNSYWYDYRNMLFGGAIRWSF